MRMQLMVLLVAAFALTEMCEAGELCPWLNAATAGGALETTAGVVVTHPSSIKEDATCDFTARTGSETRELRVEVRTMPGSGAGITSYVARCTSTPIALNAIGNEAISCSVDAGGQNVEQVAGRVRDRVFLITLRSADGSPSQSPLREKARGLAELVAGNLF
jgi:hypothetical protein